jgi:hypothetical protein
MRRLGASIGVAAILGLAVVLLAPAALAQDEDPDANDFVVLTGRLVVPEGESVQTAVILNGDAVIQGRVNETLVVFNGDTEIIGTVDGDVIALSASVVVRSGARVGGDIVSIEDPTIEEGAIVEGDIEDLPTRWDYWDITFVGRLIWWLGYTVSTLVLGLVLLVLARGLDPAAIRALRERMGGTFGFGILWFVLLPILAVLLFVTFVGIPLGLFLLLALGLIYTSGYAIGALALGRLAVKEPSSRWVAFLVGWGALRVLALIPFLGGLVWTVATIVGLGTLWVTARAKPVAMAPTAVAPVAPPPPATT